VANKGHRVRWCTRIQIWNPEHHWATIFFSDESHFKLGFSDGHAHVWWENATAMDPENLLLVRRQGATSVMVWGCITFHGVGELVMIDGNVDNRQYIQILQEHLLQPIENAFGFREMPFIFL